MFEFVKNRINHQDYSNIKYYYIIIRQIKGNILTLNLFLINFRNISLARLARLELRMNIKVYEHKSF